MTIKIIVLICLVHLLFPFTISLAQNQITVSPVVGLYIYNSENSLPVMGDKDYLLNYGFEFNYENKNLFGYNIQFGYSYLYSGVENTLRFVITGEVSPDPIGATYTDVSLSFNNLDLSVNGKLGNLFAIGIGPSFSIVDRTISIDNGDFVYEDFIDRLSSFCIGLNGLIELQIPFSSEIKYWYFYSSVKFRYLYGLFYDEGLRDLSNYNQNYVTANLAIGIGYNF